MIEEMECCIIGACCDRQKRVEALAQKIQDEVGLPPQTAMDMARWIRKHYDLAPAGTIQPLIDVVAEMAREYPYQSS